MLGPLAPSLTLVV